MSRETWLMEGVAALRPLFENIGETVPEVRVSVGWPGGRGKKDSTIGQCWAKEAASDEVAQIFISPTLAESGRVLDVLTHELVHAITGPGVGHKGEFARIAKAVGLTGKMTATVASDELEAELATIVEAIGEYPHAALTPALAGVPKQSTRMLKAECAEGSGYKVRLTMKWIEEYGAPICPCHHEVMEVAA